MNTRTYNSWEDEMEAPELEYRKTSVFNLGLQVLLSMVLLMVLFIRTMISGYKPQVRADLSIHKGEPAGIFSNSVQ